MMSSITATIFIFDESLSHSPRKPVRGFFSIMQFLQSSSELSLELGMELRHNNWFSYGNLDRTIGLRRDRKVGRRNRRASGYLRSLKYISPLLQSHRGNKILNSLTIYWRRNDGRRRHF